jgi:hypothetical protein
MPTGEAKESMHAKYAVPPILIAAASLLWVTHSASAAAQAELAKQAQAHVDAQVLLSQLAKVERAHNDLLSQALALAKEQAEEAIAEAKERAQAKEKTKNSSTAERESDGFMAYDEEEWQRLKDIHRAQSQRQRGGDHPQGSVFYQQNYEPTWSCPFERRVGNIGDGGKWVCDPHRLPDDCLVLSVGSASEWSFEEGIHALKPHCEIHTFDHTIQPHNVPSFVHFHPRGLDNSSKLQHLIESINAIGRTVDILKIDCERCEWDTFDQFEGRQVLLELHGVGRAHQLFEAMARKGYVIFHKEPNIQYGGGECVEYGFLRLNLPL